MCVYVCYMYVFPGVGKRDINQNSSTWLDWLKILNQETRKRKTRLAKLLYTRQIMLIRSLSNWDSLSFWRLKGRVKSRSIIFDKQLSSAQLSSAQLVTHRRKVAEKEREQTDYERTNERTTTKKN